MTRPFVPLCGAPRRLAGLAALAALLAPLQACTRGSSGAEPFAIVSLAEVQRMLGAPDVVVVDANSRDTFLKGHLPGAIHHGAAPLAQLLPADREARLVFYCASPT